MDGTMTRVASQNFISFNSSWYQQLTNNATRIRNTISKLDITSITTGHDIKISPNSHLFLEKLSPYQRIQITRKIASLSPTPRPRDASPQKNAENIYSVIEANTGFSIGYKVHVSTVYILEIVPNPKLMGAGKELPALYIVKRSGPAGQWVLVTKPVDSVKTPHAAINGQSNDLGRSPSLMGIHISTMFKQDGVKEFTLFHNPTDGGFWDTYESSLDKKQKTTAVSKQFSKVLADIQKKDKQVKWLAHSQGGLIFTEAARYHWVNNRTELSNNSVQFNAGANNELMSKDILKSVKIDILGFNNHPFDPVPNLIGGNAKGWISRLGSTIGLFFIFIDDQNKSPHTLPYTGNSSVANNIYDVRNKSALVVQSIVNSLPK